MSTNDISSKPEFSAVFCHGLPDAVMKPRYFVKGKTICDRLIGMGKGTHCNAKIPFGPGRGKKKRQFASSFRSGVTTQAKKRGVDLKCVQTQFSDHYIMSIVHTSDLSN